MKKLIDKLYETGSLDQSEFSELILGRNDELSQYLFSLAREVRKRYYGEKVYIRGLIEYTNYCKNDCYYCGIRRSNKNVSRYRLDRDDILACCKEGYELGFRTFIVHSLTQGQTDIYCGTKQPTAHITGSFILTNYLRITGNAVCMISKR